MLAILLPYMLPFTIMLLVVCAVHEPTMKMLLYSTLPKSYQNRLTFWLCYVEEMRFMAMLGGVAVPVWQCQVIAFDLISDKLEEIKAEAMRKKYGETLWVCLMHNNALFSFVIIPHFRRPIIGTNIIDDHYRALRSLQLYTTALNVLNSSLIFTMKLYCLCVSICSGYAAVAHFSDQPVFGIMYCVLFFEASFIYSSLYQKGFKVPDLITEAKSACRLGGRRLAKKAQRRTIIEKQLKSIPSLGIKVGEFHMLERTSTPAFLQHVLVSIVNILVTFK